MLSAAALRQVILRKCDTKCLRRQPGPRGHESSGNSLALPAIVQAMGNGKWISQQPELQRWDQEPLIPAWPFVQPSAIHMLVEKLWRGLFIRPCKFMLGLRTWFHPGPAPWVTSQPWGCKQELGQTTTLHLFVSHSAWGLHTGRENPFWKEEE